MKKAKKKASELSPVERMEDLALVAKVSESLIPHIGGLTDKTLSEYVIHLTEKQLKQNQKSTGLESEIVQSQGLRQRLADNGAPAIPLSLCKRLLSWTSEQSPRLKRWRKKQAEKKPSNHKGDSLADDSLSATFPALAKSNLGHSVPLGTDFYEHTSVARSSGERNPRGISNLPAWMTQGKSQEPLAKKRRTNDDDGLKSPQSQSRNVSGRSNAAAMSSTAVVHPGLDIKALTKNDGNRMKAARSSKQTLSEQELFEAQQLVRSGVLPVEQYPTYDANIGMLAVEETEEETEVELNTDHEAAFLRGQTKKSGRRDLEPIKIVKNPDGSLQRAAMQQNALAKERRELRQAQANQLIDSIPKDLNRPWEDPLPEAGERHFAQELRSINVMSQMDGAPEWKQKIENKTLSYGIISNKSIKEQREGLPIYQLKTELLSAMSENQVLVVIGETGSGKTVSRQ